MRDESATAARAGHGLLVGLLRCARCGRKLHTRYWGKIGTAARYLCDGDYSTGGGYCLGFGGAIVDKRVSEEILLPMKLVIDTMYQDETGKPKTIKVRGFSNPLKIAAL